TDPDVLSWNIRSGLPFDDNSMDVVYHSHVLEHLTPKEGKAFLGEGHRVLDGGGTIRIVVPDLELTVAAYLDALKRACASEPGWDQNYDWMIVELLGTLVWEESVPALFQYLRQPNVPNLPFVASRISNDVMRLVGLETSSNRLATRTARPSFLRRVKNRIV